MEANQKYQFRTLARRVWNLATSSTVGYGLMLDRTSTTKSAANVQDDARGKYANDPSATLSSGFAGVVLTSRSDAGMTHIAEPGSDCLIYVGEAVNIGDVVYVSCGDNAGQFFKGGVGLGRGAAIVHTTVSAAGTVHATLLDGSEVPAVQDLTPVAGGGAITVAADGMTLINGGTVSSADITATLADGTYVGQEKGIKITTTIGGSHDLVYTVTHGVQLDGSTALATVTLDEAGDTCLLRWTGAVWKLIANKGGALA